MYFSYLLMTLNNFVQLISFVIWWIHFKMLICNWFIQFFEFWDKPIWAILFRSQKILEMICWGSYVAVVITFFSISLSICCFISRRPCSRIVWSGHLYWTDALERSMCSSKTSEKISLSLVLSHLFKLENSPQLVQLGNWNMTCDVGQTISKDYINILT